MSRLEQETEGVASLLEMVASERPDILGWVLDLLQHSPVRFAILRLLREWEVGETRRAAPFLRKAVTDLDRLERRHWTKPQQIIPKPHLGSLVLMATARAQRIHGSVRRRRMAGIAGKLKRCYENERTRRYVDALLQEPADETIDPEWIEDFLADVDGGDDANPGGKQ